MIVRITTGGDPPVKLVRNPDMMKGSVWSAVGLAAILSLSAASASADATSPSDSGRPPLRGTPFESGPNAAALPKLAGGASVKRSSHDGTLTPDDRFRLRALGLSALHSGVVALHKIPKTDASRQIARFRKLARAVEGFSPSGACDEIVAEGEGSGLCTGSVDGPLGKVPVRMPFAAKLTEGEDGSLHLLMRNMRPLEAKPLFSWSPVVAPDHMKFAVDLYPTDDGWLVYTRIGVDMSAHESSAKTITDALVKLDTWLSRELSKS